MKRTPNRLLRAHYLRIANVFRQTQKHVWISGFKDNHWQFICLAMGELSRLHGWRELQDAREIIMERLSPCKTVEEWLGKNVSGFEQNSCNVPSEAIQNYRIRWLKSLEAEFANKGLK